MLEVDGPLRKTVCGEYIDRKTELVLDLCRDDGLCNTAGETHDDWIRNEFDDTAQTEKTHQDQ